MLRILAAPALAMMLVAAPLDAQIGLASGPRTVVLTAIKLGSVGVTLPEGRATTLAGDLQLGPNDFAPVRIETAWDLDPARTSAVRLVAYFQDPGAALAGAETAIPSSAVYARLPTGGLPGYAPFTGGSVQAGGTAAGVAGATLVLFTQAISSDAAAGRRTDPLQVRIDLTGSPELLAGQYQGFLNLLAITQ